MITLVNLNYIGARIVCRSGNVYSVAANGSVSVQPVDVPELCEQGYQQNSANPLSIPWSTKAADFTAGPGTQGYVVNAKDDPATLTVTLPKASTFAGYAFFFVPSYVGAGSPGPILAVPSAGDDIDGGPNRTLSTNSILVSDGVSSWHAF